MDTVEVREFWDTMRLKESSTSRGVQEMQLHNSFISDYAEKMGQKSSLISTSSQDRLAQVKKFV